MNPKFLFWTNFVFYCLTYCSSFRAFFYSIWGALLGFKPPIDTSDVQLIESQAGVFNWILLVVLGILVAMFLAYFFTAKYYEKKKQEKKELITP